MCAQATEIVLKPDAKIVHDESGWALSGRGIVLGAKDEVQSAILQRIDEGCVSLDDLERFVRERNGGMLRDDEASLALAEFILDFGDLLEDPASE